ncbi:MAG: hypothetical protein ACLSA2_10820 [Candidatus Gastranaerophilaceae bacterium]
MFFGIKSLAIQFKYNAQNILGDEYNHTNFYQKIILDNTVCEFSNFITIVEGLEKIMPAKVSEVLKGSIAEELKFRQVTKLYQLMTLKCLI